MPWISILTNCEPIATFPKTTMLSLFITNLFIINNIPKIKYPIIRHIIIIRKPIFPSLTDPPTKSRDSYHRR